jgi:hypothetical protein
MIDVGNLINNKILFTAGELRDHYNGTGDLPAIVFGDAVLACQILNPKTGELGITLQIRGIGLDDAAGAQIQTEFHDRDGKYRKVVTRVGTRHRLTGCDLNKDIHLTVLSIPADVLHRPTGSERLRNVTTVFSARKVRKGGRDHLDLLEIQLERQRDNIRFRLYPKNGLQLRDLNGVQIRVSCYGNDGAQAEVNVDVDVHGYTSNITGVNPNFGLRITFL